MIPPIQKYKLMNMIKITIMGFALIFMGISKSDAGINGSYKVSGSESYYGGLYRFGGSIAVNNYNSGTFNIRYSDGDRASGSYKLIFSKPLKDNLSKQTVKCNWSASGIRGTATLTFTKSKGVYYVKVNYAATGARVQGNGKGKKS